MFATDLRMLRPPWLRSDLRPPRRVGYVPLLFMVLLVLQTVLYFEYAYRAIDEHDPAQRLCGTTSSEQEKRRESLFVLGSPSCRYMHRHSTERHGGHDRFEVRVVCRFASSHEWHMLSTPLISAHPLRLSILSVLDVKQLG